MPNIALRSAYELLPIGTRVSYHHRAGVARWMQLYGEPSDYLYTERPRSGWKIVEGTLVHNNRHPETLPMNEIGTLENGYNHNTVREMFFDWPQAKFYKYWHKDYPMVKPTLYNKTVMVWPDDGFGWIMGLMKKSIGASSKSYGHGEDFEQGYHESDMYVDLYVIKLWYEGTQYILCPLWAVSEVTEDND